MSNQIKCRKPWFYLGVASGFLTGFLYFAYNVYTHGNTKDTVSYNGSTSTVSQGL